jgi:hypothetical protein
MRWKIMMTSRKSIPMRNFPRRRGRLPDSFPD